MDETPVDTPDISWSPRLAATLKVRRPIERDVHEIKLTANVTTWDVDNLMGDVPAVLEPYLRDWLMRHTRTLTGLHEIDGLTLVRTTEPKAVFEHAIDMMCSRMVEKLFEELRENVRAQLERELPGLGARPTTYPRPDTTS